MSEIVRAAIAVVTARRDHVEAVALKNTRGENAAAVRLEIALEDLDHAIAGGYTPSDPDGLDLEPVRDRWRRVLDIKPTDGAAHEAYRLKASAYDVPELLHEIGRLRELVDPAPNPWKVRTWAVANGYGAACPDGQPVPDYLTTMYRAAHRRRG